MSGFLRGAVAAVAAAGGGGGGGGGGDLSSLDASVAVVMGANASSVAAVAAAAAAAAVTASPPEAAAAATVGGGGGSPPGDPVTAEDIFGSLVSTAGTHIGGGGGQEVRISIFVIPQNGIATEVLHFPVQAGIQIAERGKNCFATWVSFSFRTCFCSVIASVQIAPCKLTRCDM